MSRHFLGYKLHVKPSYVYSQPMWHYERPGRSLRQIANEANLKRNTPNPQGSKKSDKRLRNAISWLSASAQIQRVYCKETNHWHQFRLNFITLTLPTTDHDLSDGYIKSKVLRNLLAKMRYSTPGLNYIWKAEPQANGNIHFHVFTDKFIHHKTLRKKWNASLAKHGLIQPYAAKHQAMDVIDYVDEYTSEVSASPVKLAKRYYRGKATNWQQPNTSDVRAMKDVNDVGAYVSEYMSKKHTGRREIKGRLWGCNYELSESRQCVFWVESQEQESELHQLQQPAIDCVQVTTPPDAMGAQTVLGECYYMSGKIWRNSISGQLRNKYESHLQYIRTHIPQTPDFTIFDNPDLWLSTNSYTTPNGAPSSGLQSFEGITKSAYGAESETTSKDTETHTEISSKQMSLYEAGLKLQGSQFSKFTFP